MTPGKSQLTPVEESEVVMEEEGDGKTTLGVVAAAARRACSRSRSAACFTWELEDRKCVNHPTRNEWPDLLVIVSWLTSDSSDDIIFISEIEERVEANAKQNWKLGTIHKNPFDKSSSTDGKESFG